MTDPVNQTGAEPGVSDPSTRLVTQVDPSRTLGSNPPTTDSRPVRVGDQAIIAVFPDLAAAEQAVIELTKRDFPIDRISIVGKDMESEIRISGFVTTGDVAGSSAATGAWVGGLFGVLSGTAMLFIPGLGPLVVLGPLAAAAVGAAEGALVGGAVGTLLGHFVAKKAPPEVRGARPHRQLPSGRPRHREGGCSGAAAADRAGQHRRSAARRVPRLHGPDRADREGVRGHEGRGRERRGGRQGGVRQAG